MMDFSLQISLIIYLYGCVNLAFFPVTTSILFSLLSIVSLSVTLYDIMVVWYMKPYKLLLHSSLFVGYVILATMYIHVGNAVGLIYTSVAASYWLAAMIDYDQI